MIFRALVVLSVVFIGCKSKPTLDGPCDPKQLDGLRKALPTAQEDIRPIITVTGLMEACESKLPSGVVEGMKALGNVSPADRATIIAGILGENAGFANAACADWEKNGAAAVALGPAQRAGALYKSCNYQRFELLTEAEFAASWQAGGFALLAVPMYAWLVDKNMEPAEAKRLARSMFVGEQMPTEDAPPPGN